MSLGQLPEPLSGVGSMVSTAFREPSAPATLNPRESVRAGSIAPSQLQDLLYAADAISNNMGCLVQELDSAVDELTLDGDQF